MVVKLFLKDPIYIYICVYIYDISRLRLNYFLTIHCIDSLVKLVTLLAPLSKLLPYNILDYFHINYTVS
jgi:hypothetical protein